MIALAAVILVGMRATVPGVRELTNWLFLIASAHGAGFMVLPVVLAGSHAHHNAAAQGAASGVWVMLIHTLGYFRVTTLVTFTRDSV
jgi:hypothetical protein